MYVDRESSAGETTSQERRGATQPDHRVLGNVVQCDGARAIIAAHADHDDGTVTGLWTVGKMVSINLDTTRTVGLVYAINKSDHQWSFESRNAIEVSIELIGEVRDHPEPASRSSTAASPTIPSSAPSRTASARATWRPSTISPGGAP